MTFINYHVLLNKEEKLQQMINRSWAPEKNPDIRKLHDELNYLWKRYSKQPSKK